MTDDNEPGDVNNDIVGGGGDDEDVRKSVESMIVKPLGMYNNCITDNHKRVKIIVTCCCSVTQ